MSVVTEYEVLLKKPHPHQEAFLNSKAKRRIIRAGRRSGKTTGAAIAAVRYFLDRKRVLYIAPTEEQISHFWKEVKAALKPLIAAKVFVKSETDHTIERAGTNQRIKAETAWNPDNLRGDHADLLIIDEWQLMDETAWNDVGGPMLLDRDGDAIFIYTPPSLRSQAVSKAQDPRHAAKMYKMAVAEHQAAAAEGKPPLWEAFHFSSHVNPYLPAEALSKIRKSMTPLSYRQEILAEDVEEVPNAMWNRALIEKVRVYEHPPLVRIVVAVDPPGGAVECGIIVAGIGPCSCKGTPERHAFVLEDRSLKDAPDKWAREAIAAVRFWKADRVIVEKNYGGDMVENTIRTIDPNIPYKSVTASGNKAVRAEPISALYEQLKVHHVRRFEELENEMISWQLGSSWSPNRLDALVWALTELMLGEEGPPAACYGSDDDEPERRNFSGFGLSRWAASRPRIERPSGSIWDRADEIGRGLFGN